MIYVQLDFITSFFFHFFIGILNFIICYILGFCLISNFRINKIFLYPVSIIGYYLIINLYIFFFYFFFLVIFYLFYLIIKKKIYKKIFVGLKENLNLNYSLILLICSFINATLVHGPFKELTGWGLTDTYFYISSIYSEPINFILFKENYFFDANWTNFQRLYYYFAYFYKNLTFFDPFLFFSVTLFVFSFYFIRNAFVNFYIKELNEKKKLIIILIIFIIIAFPYLYYLFESPPAFTALPLFYSLYFYNEYYEKFSKKENIFLSIILIISLFLTKFSLVLFLLPIILFNFYKKKKIFIILINILIIFLLFLFLTNTTLNIQSLINLNFSKFTSFKELGNFQLLHRIIQLSIFFTLIYSFLRTLFINPFFFKFKNFFYYNLLINTFFYFFTSSSNLNLVILGFQSILKFLSLPQKNNYYFKKIIIFDEIKYSKYFLILFTILVLISGFLFNTTFFIYISFFLSFYLIFFKKNFLRYLLLLVLISIFIKPKQDMVTTYDQKKIYFEATKYRDVNSIFFTDLNETIINGPINFYASISNNQYFLLNWYWDFFNSISKDKRIYYQYINKNIINGSLNPNSLDYFKNYKNFYIITFYNKKKKNSFELIYNYNNFAIYKIIN
jgi:hypothetical protein